MITFKSHIPHRYQIITYKRNWITYYIQGVLNAYILLASFDVDNLINEEHASKSYPILSSLLFPRTWQKATQRRKDLFVTRRLKGSSSSRQGAHSSRHVRQLITSVPSQEAKSEWEVRLANHKPSRPWWPTSSHKTPPPKISTTFQDGTTHLGTMCVTLEPARHFLHSDYREVYIIGTHYNPELKMY